MGEFAVTEIVALARVVDELDYYEILRLPREAQARDIRRAYHDASRRFHPDAHRQQGDELRGASAAISKRVCEAYTVLRDPRRRRVYDDFLEQGDGTRLPLGQLHEQATQRDRASRQGNTAQGQQFFRRGLADMKREDWTAAARNLRTAKAFEPANAEIEQKLEEAKAQLSERKA